MNTVLRSASVLALLAAALAASAQTTAFSDLGSAPGVYLPGPGSYYFGDGQSAGFQFTATASGLLSGLAAAINNPSASSPVPFTLSLLADNGSDQYGPVLGSFSAQSTGQDRSATTSALSTVVVVSPSIPIVSGAKYWLRGSLASGTLDWNYADSGTMNRNFAGVYFYGQSAAAFSVSVTPTPEPSALAALGLGAVALLRRRNRA